MALPRFTIPITSGVIALGAWFVHIVAVPPDIPASSGDASVAQGTPVLSSRRAPTMLAQANATVYLGSQLDAALGAELNELDTCLVVRQRGQAIYTLNAFQPLIPASNEKLVTAYTALTIIPPDTKYVTEVRSDVPVDGGVIVGNVWVSGSGDPLLSTDLVGADFAVRDDLPPVRTRLEDLATAIDQAGVTRISGSVVGDESRYDSVRYQPTWKSSYATQGEVGPQSAFTVNRNFATWETRRPSGNPPALGAELLTAELQAVGVTVNGPPVSGDAPEQATYVVASVASPPFADIAGDTLRDSDNLAAELILKEVAVRTGAEGTTANGSAVAFSKLTELGVDTSGIVIVDGSGLDRGNRQTCQSLSVVLDAASAATPTVLEGLPISGTTGTLADRMQSDALKGKIRAKTGALSGVAALSGFATASNDTQLTFSLLANGLASDQAGRNLQDAVAKKLVAYPTAPPTELLAPPESVAAQKPAATP
jgi:D-alanyl-D-alanine carboxypeptidase/D-alanyl-D-alanine-endopeptidase (penicillin-binding protein 4)